MDKITKAEAVRQLDKAIKDMIAAGFSVQMIKHVSNACIEDNQ